ncbi:MAG TPA: DUF2203 domain-containing protein [Gaiellales bacterium]|jgi:hypothetical protein|nr:DUF2203 domain-containing protein [Gaiellales bacterium]
MADERLFTVAEAQELLDRELRAEAERMVEACARGRDLEARWRRLVISIGSNGGNFAKPEVRELRAELEQAHAELGEIVQRFTDQGVQVKDIDSGLIDFPAEIDGEPALLCWRVGEERIEFWHTLDGGFAGRRPLA